MMGTMLTTLAEGVVVFPDKGLALAGIAIGVGLIVAGAAKGIGHIAGNAGRIDRSSARSPAERSART